jgi:peroxiredoxin
MPALQQLAQDLRGQPFRMYSVDLQEDAQAIESFQRQYNLDLYVLLDDEGSVTRTYGVRGLPATFLIDRQGVVRVQRLGPLLAGGPETTWSEPWLAEQVRGLLAAS